MTSENYHFKIGTFDCMVVNDGIFAYPHPAQLFFPDVSPQSLKEALHVHQIDPADWDVYISPYPSLVVNTGEQLVLVDTGAAGLAPTTGKLLSNLQKEGIAPEDIDIVILTHGHPDHIGGALDTSGQPAFSNARHVMGQNEWDFWAAEPDLSHLRIPEELKGAILQMARTNLPPLREQLQLIKAGTEIIPGIQALAAPGHTPGHLALDIASNGEHLLAVSDAVVHPVHVAHPEWVLAFDYSPQQVLETRRRLLKRAADQEALVFAYHFALPSLGHVIEDSQGWQWQPLEAIT